MIGYFQFSLFRLNIVNEPLDLFLKSFVRGKGDGQLIKLLKIAGTGKYDIERKRGLTVSKWGLRATRNFKIGSRIIVSCVLVKSTPIKEGRIVSDNDIHHGISESSPPLGQTAIIFFDLSRHIAIVERNSAIKSIRYASSVLRDICKKASYDANAGFSLHLEPIPEKDQILNAFKNMEIVTSLRVALRIPNPEINLLAKSIYEELKNGGIEEYLQEMKNPNGISKKSNHRPALSLKLAEQGYKTNVKIEGKDSDGNRVVRKPGNVAVEGSAAIPKEALLEVVTKATTKKTTRIVSHILNEADKTHPPESE